ncbi:MAG: hypothetical protein ACI31O_07440 [Limosilactobacillus vaginalis]|jgi:regulator of replication initiation timing
MNNNNAEAIVQNLLNKVGTLEYQNTLLQVENESLKKQVSKDDKKKGDK